MKNPFNHNSGRLSLSMLAVAVLLMSSGCDPGTQSSGNNTTGNVGASPTPTANATSPERDREAVAAVINGAVNETQRVTQNRDNLAAGARSLDKYFDEDVTIIDSSGFTKGWSTYREKNLEGQLRSVASSYRVGGLNINIVGDMAVASYPYTINADVNGKTTTIFGYGTTALRRRGSDWKIIHTQSSGRPMKETDPKF